MRGLFDQEDLTPVLAITNAKDEREVNIPPETKSERSVSAKQSKESSERIETTAPSQSKEAETSVIKFSMAAFLIANTFFLVHEQVSFFLLKNYALWQAIFFAVLMEAAILLLSFLAGYVVARGKKTLYYFLLAGSVFVSARIVCNSIEKRDLKESAQSDYVLSLQKRISVLEVQEAEALKNIQALDPDRYPTRRAEMVQGLEEGITADLSRLVAELNIAGTKSGLVDGETETMKWMRLLAIVWNVVLAHTFPSSQRSSQTTVIARDSVSEEVCHV